MEVEILSIEKHNKGVLVKYMVGDSEHHLVLRKDEGKDVLQSVIEQNKTMLEAIGTQEDIEAHKNSLIHLVGKKIDLSKNEKL